MFALCFDDTKPNHTNGNNTRDVRISSSPALYLCAFGAGKIANDVTHIFIFISSCWRIFFCKLA
jgi:hypothetical protein